MTNLYDDKFYIRHRAVSEVSGSVILPLLDDIVRPKTCIDVGCGIGTWLSVAQEHWGCGVVGVDGDYVDRNQLCVDPADFRAHNLADSLPPLGRFDLAICMEVIEHLPPSRGESLIAELCSLSDIILFSGAVPNQGGVDHVNEQWPSIWVTEFERNGFRCFDIIRPFVWSDERVAFYYRQNAFVATSQTSSQSLEKAMAVKMRTPTIWDVAHPTRISKLVERIDGPISARRALRILVRSIAAAVRRRLPGR